MSLGLLRILIATVAAALLWNVMPDDPWQAIVLSAFAAAIARLFEMLVNSSVKA